MAISVTVIVLNQPYGNPGSVGEPLGIFGGDASVTGDATGGTLQCTFNVQNPTDTPTLDDHRLQYVWFIDQIAVTGESGSGLMSMLMFGHYARPNSALATPITITTHTTGIVAGGTLTGDRNMIMPGIERFPIFWDSQELGPTGNNALVNFLFNANVNAGNYRFQVMGRYYDKQILSNRAFGRLISPPALSQFEG